MPDEVSLSILNSVKKTLGVDPSYEAWDSDIILFINGALADLHMLGVGPDEGFAIEDETALWEDFLGGEDPRLNNVQTLVFLKVRLMFDPPAQSFHIDALERQIKQKEFLIGIHREEVLRGDVV